eukprot:143320-Pyramimonas_sp.AAC.1
MATFRPQLDELSRKMQRQIDDVTGKVATLSIELDSHTEQLRQLRAEIAELREGLHVAKRQEAAPSPPANFDRQTDPAVVVAMCTKMVGLSQVRDVLAPFLSELGFEADQYTLSCPSPTPARRFLIKFNGATGLASKKVSKVLSNLRRNDQWRVFNVEAS